MASQSSEMPSPERVVQLLTNLQSIRSRIAKLHPSQAVRLVLVSKLKPASNILALHTHTPPFDDGINVDAAPRRSLGYEQQPAEHFGENYLQELLEKAAVLPQSIRWHFIGNLQIKKAKKLAKSIPNLWCVSSVDSSEKADLLDNGRAECQADNNEVDKSQEPLRVLVQVNTSGEDSKSGVAPDEALELCRHITKKCAHLKLAGLMTIGALANSYATKQGAENEDFKCLVQVRSQVAQSLDLNPHDLELSMGMSADFEEAITAGSTEVRIGSTIFGERPPKSIF